MEQRGVSLATVLRVYRTLEERGLVAARPKSGHFVADNGSERAGRARPMSVLRRGLSQPSLSPGQLFSAHNSYGHCVRIDTFLADQATVTILVNAVKQAFHGSPLRACARDDRRRRVRVGNR